MNRITILGSGTSTGVPILGCTCKVCQSTEVRNKRYRTSALLSIDDKNILIDASPDLRTQLLAHKIDHLEGVIITHDHADHTHGMDDLRPFTFKSKNPISVHTDSVTAQSLRKKFPYIFDRDSYFEKKQVLGGGIPLLDLKVADAGVHQILNQEFEFFSLPHGHENTLGILHRKMAYITDCRIIPDEVIERLAVQKLELLVIDCLRPAPHQTHLHLDLTLEYIRRINPGRSVLIHLGHEWDHLELLAEIKKRGVKNTFPAIDGQSFLYS